MASKQELEEANKAYEEWKRETVSRPRKQNKKRVVLTLAGTPYDPADSEEEKEKENQAVIGSRWSDWESWLNGMTETGKKEKEKKPADAASSKEDSKGAAINRSAILSAAKYGKTDQVRALLSTDRSLARTKNRDGLTPYDYALKYGHHNTAQAIRSFQ